MNLKQAMRASICEAKRRRSVLLEQTVFLEQNYAWLRQHRYMQID